MLLNLEIIKNKKIKTLLEHGLYVAIVLLLIPGTLYFELCVVLPSLYEEWTVQYVTHFTCAIFLLHNVVGNLIFGSCTDTSIKGRLMISSSAKNSDWTFCAVCESLRPPRAWHCNHCDICILKRDHHCSFFAYCIGYFNHRYFILFTFYVFISMVYAFYYNVIFVSKFISWNKGLVVIKFIFPMLSFFIDTNQESIYILLIDLNVLIAAFSGFLFFYHFNNILKGKTIHEVNHSIKSFSSDNLMLNLIEIFGTRWYLAWISPFIKSPLLGNGIQWLDRNK